MTARLFCWLLACWASVAAAEPFDYALQPTRLAPGVHAFFGRTEDFNRQNGGNIVNTGVIETAAGLIVIDSGPSLRYGQQMRAVLAAQLGQPVRWVINTHHHPDHFLGNLAFADLWIGALPATRQGMEREGNAFAENLFRLSGDWLKGSEVQLPNQSLSGGVIELGGRRLRLLALNGHSGADLVVYDEASGVLFAGDLVFHDRAPTTPHADLPRWQAALQALSSLTREPGFRQLLPGHGPAARDDGPIRQTADWLRWLDEELRSAAQRGLDMSDLLARPLPARFARLALAQEEFRRSVVHLFPAIEAEVLGEVSHGH